MTTPATASKPPFGVTQIGGVNGERYRITHPPAAATVIDISYSAGPNGKYVSGPHFTAAEAARVRVWMNQNGFTDQAKQTNILGLFATMATDVGNYNVATAPIAQNPLNLVTNPIHDLTGLIEAITNPNTWLRVGEFLLGAILLGIGVAHLFPATQTVLKSVPVYGKAMP